MNGWLVKDPALLGKARRRYFVAIVGTSKVVHTKYFVDATREVCKGEFFVDTRRSSERTVEVLPDGLSFAVETTKRRLVLSAATPEECAAWVALYQGKAPPSKPETAVTADPTAAAATVTEGGEVTEGDGAASPKSELEIELVGVSAAFLLSFQAEHAASGWQGLTTAQVCEQVVKVKTQAQRCSYVQWLAGQQPPAETASLPSAIPVGPANVFVSHAWQGEISDLFAVLLDFASAHPASFFWVDLFCRNQHAAAAAFSAEWWSGTLAASIAAMGRMLVVVAPWQQPTFHSRSWCIWEMFLALQGQTPLTLGLPAKEQRSLTARLLADRSIELQLWSERLVDVHIERASASVLAEQEGLLAAARASKGGAGAVNRMVSAHLRDWLRATTAALAESHAETVLQTVGPAAASVTSTEGALAAASLLETLADALSGLGELGGALRLLGRALDLLQAALGPSPHPRVARLQSSMGQVFHRQGEQAAAIQLLRQALEASRATLGEQHVQTALACSSLGRALQALGQVEQALDHYQSALASLQQLGLGDSHPDAAALCNQMGRAYSSLGEHGRALDMHRQALTIYQRCRREADNSGDSAGDSKGWAAGRDSSRKGSGGNLSRSTAAAFAATRSGHGDGDGDGDNNCIGVAPAAVSVATRATSSSSSSAASLASKANTSGLTSAPRATHPVGATGVARKFSLAAVSAAAAAAAAAATVAALQAAEAAAEAASSIAAAQDSAQAGQLLLATDAGAGPSAPGGAAAVHRAAVPSVMSSPSSPIAAVTAAPAPAPAPAVPAVTAAPAPAATAAAAAAAATTAAAPSSPRPTDASVVATPSRPPVFAFPLSNQHELQLQAALVTTYEDIGLALDGQGDFAQALTIFSRALAEAQARYGEQHAVTAGLHAHLGSTSLHMGQAEQALEHFARALKVQLVVAGPQHPDTASAYGNIGRTLHSMGEHAKALEMYAKAMKIQLATLGEQHPDTATTFDSMGRTYHSQGDYPEALALFKKALQITLATLGEQHPDTAATYNNLGGVYVSLRQYDEALAMYEQSLAIKRRKRQQQPKQAQRRLSQPPPPPPPPQQHHEQQQQQQQPQPQPQQEQKQQQQGREKLDNELDEMDLDMAATYNNMGTAFDGLGQPARALAMYEKALVIVRGTLGEQHPSTAATYSNTAGALSRLGEYERAEPLYAKALAIKQAIFGPAHLSTLTALNHLASLHADHLHKPARALELYSQALQVRLSALGEQHAQTASTLMSMAVCCRQLGQAAQAAAHLARAAGIFATTLGEAHATTAECQALLQQCEAELK